MPIYTQLLWLKLVSFLLFKFTPILGLSDSYIYIVTFVGLTTMIFGSVTALRQYDLKGILAYSTIK